MEFIMTKYMNFPDLSIIFLLDQFLPTFLSIVREHHGKTAYSLVRIPSILSSAHI